MARKAKGLKLKPIIAVYCEGESEQAYFEMLRRKYHAANVHTEKLEISSLGMSGLTLLRKAKSKRDHHKGRQVVDQTYVVFDRDALRQQDLIECEHFARDNDMTIVLSSINFEIWVLMHYQAVNRVYSAVQLVQILSGSDFFGENYHRFKGNDYDVYLLDRVRTAEINAQRLREQGQGQWYDRNPYTQVDEAVIAIFGVNEQL